MARSSCRRVARSFVGILGLASLVSISPAFAQIPSVGLSTVRSQRFHNENLLGFYTPEAGDRFGFAVATGDFNGDGADDLATSMPFDDGLADTPIEDSGSVVVRFGAPGVGLASNLASAVLRQVPYRDPAEVGDQLGSALVACDFNGDGFDDLAIGLPFEDHLGKVDQGGVQVHYGSSTLGINFDPEDFFTQSSPGIPGTLEYSYQHFGEFLACGDFDGDSFDDLVVSAPRYWIQPGLITVYADGMVVVVPGTAFGLDHHAAFAYTQETEGVAGDVEADGFGEAIGVGDFNGDGFDDLAVGSAWEDNGQGAIHVFFGSPDSLTVSGSLFWMETFVGGLQENGDHFGQVLTTGDFDGDGFDDLVVSMPGEDLGIQDAEWDAGQIAVIFGSRLGPDRGHVEFWSEDEILGPGTSEKDDLFGSAITAGDFDKDGFDDLAIGHSGENGAAGQVTILRGSGNGLSDARTRDLAAGLEGFPGTAGQENQRFAHALASGDFDGDGHSDLAIGIPEDDVDGRTDVGSEVVSYGALFADGVDNGDLSFWSSTQSSSAGNRVAATKEARLGPSSAGKFGLEFLLAEGSPRRMPEPSFVRVSPDRGLADERRLSGSFFVNPQKLTMPVGSLFQFMSFADGVGPGGRTRFAFDLVRTATTYSLSASFFNEATGLPQFAGSGVIANVGDPNGGNMKLDFEWRAGSPGHLTVFRTAFPFGAPDAQGKVQLFSVALPNTPTARINHVTAGVIVGQSVGTTGVFALDELSFRR
jgi:hypothetical protein